MFSFPENLGSDLRLDDRFSGGEICGPVTILVDECDRKLPAGAVLRSRGVGSFDCIAGRFADGNFAQDDSLVWSVFG